MTANFLTETMPVKKYGNKFKTGMIKTKKLSS